MEKIREIATKQACGYYNNNIHGLGSLLFLKARMSSLYWVK